MPFDVVANLCLQANKFAPCINRWLFVFVPDFPEHGYASSGYAFNLIGSLTSPWFSPRRPLWLRRLADFSASTLDLRLDASIFNASAFLRRRFGLRRAVPIACGLSLPRQQRECKRCAVIYFWGFEKIEKILSLSIPKSERIAHLYEKLIFP